MSSQTDFTVYLISQIIFCHLLHFNGNLLLADAVSTTNYLVGIVNKKI